MRNWLIGIGIALVCGALGVGAAYGAKELINNYAPQVRQAVRTEAGLRGAVESPDGVLRNGMGPGGMMRPGFNNPEGGLRNRLRQAIDRRQGAEISLEDATAKAEAYAADLGSGFTLAETMEFERNYYFVFVETQTGRGAFELLVNRYGGATSLEPGPGMMWNLKYGPAQHQPATGGATDNTLTLAEARQAAQQYLDKTLPGATVGEGGYAFYGYFTFDYSVDGKTAGMLSVNGLDGQVWPHTWHGEFLSEKERTQ